MEMEKILIESNIVVGRKLKGFSQETLKNEPMFFNCTWTFAYDNGGTPTKNFLLSLPENLHNDQTIIDSRVHMLMEGWFPCIPGFHHDDVPREREDGQPEYHNPSYRSQHALILYNGDVCPSEFALGESEFPEVPMGEKYYKVWHPLVVEKIKRGELESFLAPSDTVIYFDDRTWHQGTRTKANGWRLFIRASWNTTRKPTNEIRRQVQVYLENPMEGW
jgi:hypothetical protein